MWMMFYKLWCCFCRSLILCTALIYFTTNQHTYNSISLAIIMNEKQPLLIDTPSTSNTGYPNLLGYGKNPPSYEYQVVPPPPPPRYDCGHQNVIITQPGYTTPVYHPPSDNYLTLSICLTVLSFFCGSWLSLFCTIPAIIAAVNAREAEIIGDMEKRNHIRCTALGLNIVGFIFGLLVTIGAWVYIYLTYLKYKQSESKDNPDY